MIKAYYNCIKLSEHNYKLPMSLPANKKKIIILKNQETNEHSNFKYIQNIIITSEKQQNNIQPINRIMQNDKEKQIDNILSPHKNIKTNERDQEEKEFNRTPKDVSYNQMSQQIKQLRTKERNLLEIIKIVSKWRKLHKTNGEKGKINLQEAARLVGISKKSLDDYYCQLRLGQKYGFDFKSNINEKVGVLRSYIRTHRDRQQTSSKYQKHPKQLKILNNLHLLISQTAKQNIIEVQRDEAANFHQNSLNYEQTNLQLKDIFHTSMDNISQQQMQNQFYKCNDLMIGQIDPFISYKATQFRSFKKRETYCAINEDFEDFLELQPMPWQF